MDFETGESLKNKTLFSREGLLDMIQGDELEVTLKIKVFSPNFDPVLQGQGTLKSSKEEDKEMRDQLFWDLGNLLGSEDGADVEISVPLEEDEEAFFYTKKVHKLVLMARSSVFSKMFGMESKMAEAITGKVVIEDLSKKGLDVFLHYIYHGEVLEDWVQVPEEILNAAEKYDLEILKQYCGKHLISAVTTRNAGELYRAAKLHNLPDAKIAIAKFIEKNLKAVLDEDEFGEQSQEEEFE